MFAILYALGMFVADLLDRPITPGSPWQNGIAEGLIGTMRRECLDQVAVFGEAHLRRVLSAYAAYYNHASVFAEGCAVATSPTSRQHRRHPDPWWITSPIRPDIIFGKDSHCYCKNKTPCVPKTSSVLIR
jgi:hypothetical protein